MKNGFFSRFAGQATSSEVDIDGGLRQAEHSQALHLLGIGELNPGVAPGSDSSDGQILLRVLRKEQQRKISQKTNFNHEKKMRKENSSDG